MLMIMMMKICCVIGVTLLVNYGVAFSALYLQFEYCVKFGLNFDSLCCEQENVLFLTLKYTEGV